MVRIRFWLVVASAMLLLGSVAQVAEAASLEAGVSVVDITPPVGWRMSGYFRERLSTGIKDPLHAKTLVFKQGDVQVALVFCDLIGISAKLSQRVALGVEKATGIPRANVCVAATHSHTGPLYAGALRGHFHRKTVEAEGRDSREPVDYVAQLAEKIVAGVKTAQAAAEPVMLEAGVAQQFGLSFNRRFHMKTGPVRFNPGVLNPDIVRVAGPIDPEVGLLLLKNAADEKPLAALTVFALHLDTTGGTLYSADYPFFLERKLRERLGEKCVSFFGIGTCGDINHVDVTRRERLKTDVIGQTLGTTVLEALPKLETVVEPSLAMRTKTIDVPMQKFSEQEIADARRMMDQVGDRKVPFLDRVKACKIVDCQQRGGQVVPVTVQAVRLNRDVALVALPGEVFVDLGLAIKKASPFTTTIVYELANDAPGYIPTRRAFQEGSYETVNSRVETGGGEAMVATAVDLLDALAK